MLDAIRYVSGCDPNASADLNGAGALVGSAASMRGRAWSYELAARGLSGVTRQAREVTVEAAFYDPAKADLLRRLADRDMAAGTPGRIYIGEWFQRAYVTAFEPSAVSEDVIAAELSIALMDGAWSRLRMATFEISENAGEGGCDLPCDLPYDVGSPRPASFVEASQWAESPARLRIYGPCAGPRVRIGQNDYQAFVAVPAGGNLVIDGLAKTATLTYENGDTRDVFASCLRGTGLGGGAYAFQPLPAGSPEVSWDGTFKFDLEWYEQEGEPPWASS